MGHPVSWATWRDYRREASRVLTLVRNHPAPAFFLVIPTVLLSSASLIDPALRSFRIDLGGWEVLVVLGFWSVALALFAVPVLWVRSRLAPETRATEGGLGEIWARWARTTLVYLAKSLLFLLPVLVPAIIAAGVAPQWAAQQSWFEVYQKVGSAALLGLLGYFYLWTFPVAGIFPRAEGRDLQRWSEGLSARTWPLALLWGLWGMVLAFLPPDGWPAILLLSVQGIIQAAVAGAQVFLLADRAREPGFGP
jgi:hypothetical protein